MNALDLTPDERAQVTEGAIDCFAGMTGLFGALYPIASEDLTHLATSINHEAGRHAVPDDPRELEAAVRAGDLCFARYPYLQQRYGERGRRFSRSDAAWKATLYRFETDQMIQQVRWLATVLAARGMPSVLLQVTLEILIDELSLAVPERQAQYEELSKASLDLLASRRRHFTDDQLKILTGEFAQAVGDESARALPEAPLLLVCSVADEAEGREGAVTSLYSWLADPTHFPAAWILSVETTLAQARQFAAESSRRELPHPL